MIEATEQQRRRAVPRRLSALVFAVKANLLRLRRGVQDTAAGTARRYPRCPISEYPYILAESRTPLWTETTEPEKALQWGKVQNLRCALRRLNGAAVPAGEVFSFWKQIGRATRAKGYVPGRQLSEGCLIPAIGGGLCQLSNALYAAALEAGLEITERYPHSQVVPGSAAEQGRDATVAWNYIDLRFRASEKQPFQIEARLTSDELIVRLRAPEASALPAPPSPVRRSDAPKRRTLPVSSGVGAAITAMPNSCQACGVESCFRHRGAMAVQRSGAAAASGRTAYLVDERWPEFESYLAEHRTDRDVLAIPLDGARWRQARYIWETGGYHRLITATGPTLRRSWSSRRLARYGAARLQAGLNTSETLARCFSAQLTPDITRLCVAQSLLPFLWRDGHLGGRRFEVLMTRLPLQTLHARLDEALAAYPERDTLGEYRAPDWVVAVEAEALAAAERIITPHQQIAPLFPGRSHRLDWRLPPPRTVSPGTAIAFPGPTAARKGAYELRAAVADAGHGCEMVVCGSELEGPGFWDGVSIRRPAPGRDWLEGVTVVVQPALVEDNPRRLLTALAAGVPVIVTPACGLDPGWPGVITVPNGDQHALCDALEQQLSLAAGGA